jgi:hypothetical protein
MRACLLVPLTALFLNAAQVAGAGQPAASPDGPAGGQPPALVEALRPLQFLLGSWEGTGTGAPGASTGTAGFTVDLQGHALLRRATNDAPTGHHEDLMVIYPGTGDLRALYIDNEQHVISYRVTVTSDPRGAVFLSEETPGAPRFRLTYALGKDGVLTTSFAMAGPGAADFKTYVEGTSKLRAGSEPAAKP